MKYEGTAYEVAGWMAETAEAARMNGKEVPRFSAKVVRKKRSLTQNAYYWVLLGELGQVLEIPKDELHLRMLQSYGCFDAFTVRADVPLADYFRYYDIAGEGFLDGVRYVHVRAYKRSSHMDRAEFGKLLDGVIQECEQQGINTMTPQEIARLEWIGGGECEARTA